MKRSLFAKRLLLFILPVLLLSCENDKEVAFEKPYYDLKGFMETEIERLEKEQPTVEKTITTQGEQEKQTLGNINWKDELASFVDLDINKPSWRNSYVADTFATDTTITYMYTTVLDDHPICYLRVELDKNGKCLNIEGERKEDNFVYSIWQNLSYSPGDKYSIMGSQKFHFIFSTPYQVHAKFIGG